MGEWSKTEVDRRPLHRRFLDPVKAEAVEVVPSWPGTATLLVATLLYLACLAAATYPMVTTFGSRLPGLSDPVQHLGVLRWYRTCLLEGRSP